MGAFCSLYVGVNGAYCSISRCPRYLICYLPCIWEWHRACSSPFFEWSWDHNLQFAGGNEMPRRDGTGPKGKGPMTGTCSGACMLRIPDRPDEPVEGFAGSTGRPFSFGGKQEDRKEVFDMPRGDRIGPTGSGPGSGRKRGLFAGFGVPGDFDRSQASAFTGRCGGGQGRRKNLSNSGQPGGQPSSGSRFGRGLRSLSTPDSDPAPDSRLETLKGQAQHLERVLDGIKRQVQKILSGADNNQQV
jgi:hypothetical protein